MSLIALPVLAVSPASAATVGGWEIDGNMPVGTTGNYDAGLIVDPATSWTDPSVPSMASLEKTSDGIDDSTQFDPGQSKETNDPTMWGYNNTGTATGKADMIDGWAGASKVGTDVYAYFAFTRNGNGKASYFVEFNKDAGTAVGPVRQPGDLLFQFDTQTGTGVTISNAYVYTLGQPSNDCEKIANSNPAASWCPTTISTAVYSAATGDTALGAGTFAEGVINLSLASQAAGFTCLNDFGAVRIRSNSSTSIKSSAADYLAPLPLVMDSNCPKLEINKIDAGGNLLFDATAQLGATFMLSMDPSVKTPSTGKVYVTDGAGADASVTIDGITLPRIADGDGANGKILIDPAREGEYTITEVAPPNGDYLIPQTASWTITLPLSGDAPAGLTCPASMKLPASALCVTDPVKWKLPTMTKTATATFEPSWTIKKEIETAPGVWADANAAADAPVLNTTDASVPTKYRVSVSEGAKGNYVVSGPLTITNPNAGAMNVTLTDPMFTDTANWTCTGIPTDTDPNVAGIQFSLASGANVFNYACTKNGDAPASAGTQTASLTWEKRAYPMSQADVSAVAGVMYSPAVEPATPATYTFVPSPRTAKVTDTQHPDWNPDVPGDQDWEVTWGTVPEPREYTITRTPTAGTCTTYDNTASIGTASDKAYVKICRGAAVTASKTSSVIYKRTYAWDVTKTVDSTDEVFWGSADATGKITASVPWKVTVTAGAATDSGQAPATTTIMSGTITLTNPNDFPETGVQVRVTDLPDFSNVAGVTWTKCTVNGVSYTSDALVKGALVTVPAKTADGNGSLEVDYVCELAGTPTNVTTGDYDQANNDVTVVPEGNGTHTYPTAAKVTYNLTTDDIEESSVNKTVTLQDLLQGEGITPTVNAGTTPWPTSITWTSGGSWTYQFTTDVTIPSAGTCIAGGVTNQVNVKDGDVVLDSSSDNAQVCAPAISKTMTGNVELKHHWKVTKVAESELIELGAGQTEATAKYRVTVSPDGAPTYQNATLSGTITLTNPSSVSLTGVTVTDDSSSVPGWTCTAVNPDPVTVPAAADGKAGTKTVDVTCTKAAGTDPHAAGTNKATMTWGGKTLSTEAAVTFTEKDVDKQIDVMDAFNGADPVKIGTATVGDKFPKTFPTDGTWLERTITAPDAGKCLATAVTNVASVPGDSDSVDVMVCREAKLQVSKTAAGTLTRTYAWDISKSVTQNGKAVTGDQSPGTFDYGVTVTPKSFADSGWKVSGEITVTNPNTYTTGGISATFTDSLTDAGAKCVIKDGTRVVYDNSVDPIKSVAVEFAPNTVDKKLTYSCTFDAKPAYDGTNVATAHWTDPQAKDAQSSGSDLYSMTDSITKVNDTIKVYDDKTVAGASNYLGDYTWPADGKTPYTFATYSVTHEGVAGQCTPYTNKAWIDLDKNEKLNGETPATTTVSVCKGIDLEITKDAELSFTRTYPWSVKKTAPETVFVGKGADGKYTATIPYTVVVTAGDYKDSGAIVANGADLIKVTNSNDWDIPITGITDTLTVKNTATNTTLDPVSCTVTLPNGDPVPADYVIPADSSKTFAYSCDLGFITNVADYAFTNTAKVTWDAAAAHTPKGVDDTGVVVVKTKAQQPTEVDKSVTLSDVYQGQANTPVLSADSPNKPWPATAADALTWKSGGSWTYEFTKTYELTGVDLANGGCTAADALVTNKAVVDIAGATDPSDTVKTEVCALGVSKTVTAEYGAVRKWTIEKGVSLSKDGPFTATLPQEIPTNGDVTVWYAVKAIPNGSVDDTTTFEGKILVNNPSTMTPVTVTVTDNPQAGDWTCTVQEGVREIAAGRATPAEFTFTCSGGTRAQNGVNVATVTYANGQNVVSAEVPVTFKESAGALHQTITVTDSMQGKLGTATWNAEGTATDFTVYSKTLKGADMTDGTCKAFENIASAEGATPGKATVTVCEEAPLTISKDAAGTYSRAYNWTVAKSVLSPTPVEVRAGETVPFSYKVVATPTLTDSNYVVTGKITVVNDNAYDPKVGISGDITATVTDTLSESLGAVSCTVNAGKNTVLVPAGQPVTVAYTCEIPAAKVGAAPYTNTAAATWVDPSGKTANAIPTAGKAATVPVTFKQTVTTNQIVDVYDDYANPGTAIALFEADATNPDTWSKTYEIPLPDANKAGCKLVAGQSECTNTAWIDLDGKKGEDGPGAGPDPKDPQDSKTVVIAQELAPVLTKTATTSYTRTYNWKIDKSVNGASSADVVVDPKTGKATVDYNVNVKSDGYVDSSWKVTGTITVTNPNQYAGGGLVVTVRDIPVKLPSATCSLLVDGKSVETTEVSVAPGKAADVAYECTFASKPDYTGGSNTAAGTYDPAGAATVANADATKANVSVTFNDAAPTTEVNKQIVVIDQLESGKPVVLNDTPITWAADLNVNLPYTVTLDGVAGGVKVYNNTAWVQPPGDTTPTPGESITPPDTATVTVRDPKAVTAVQGPATATYDESFAWAIGKAAAVSQITGAPGTTQTVAYLVTVTPGARTTSGYELSGSVTLTNGNDTARTVKLSQVVTVGGPTTCSFDGGATVELAPRSQVTKQWNCQLTGTGYVDGKSVITGDVVNGGPEGKTVLAEQPITFTIDTSTNKTITVVDDKTVPGTSTTLGTATWNAAGTPTQFPYNVVLTIPEATSTFLNTAMVVETEQKADTPVVAIPVRDVTAAQTITASYDEAFAWAIGKATTTSTITGAPGSTHTVPYAVTVTPGARTTSGYELSGKVTVSNPNETARKYTLSQEVTVGGPTTCSFEGGAVIEVPAKGQVTTTWTCQLTGTGYVDGKSVITATPVGKVVTADPVPAVVSEQPIVFAVDVSTNKTITVVDDKTVPGTSTTLGTATWNAAGTPVTFAYNVTLTMPSTSGTFLNTAMVVETKQKAEVPVKANPVVPTPSVSAAPAIVVPSPTPTPQPSVSLTPVPAPTPTVAAGAGAGGIGITKGKVPKGHSLPSTGAPAGLQVALWSGIALAFAGLVLLTRSRRRA